MMPRFSKQTPRITPVEPPYDRNTEAVLDPLGPPIQLFRVFARRPDLARGVHGWGQYYLSRRSALSIRQRELVIDRTTALCGADYEWAIHIAAFAEKADLSEQQVRSLACGSFDDECWSNTADGAVLRAVDELHETYDLCDSTWSALSDAVGEDGALDVILVCGWYHAISFAVRALRLPLEPGTSPLAEVVK
jgi:Carboxymuconolactone decarboxylase family